MATLVYFDLFDYPLTIFEIQKRLFGNKTEISNIFDKLQLLQGKGIIGLKNGFYFLNGKDWIIQQRLERYLPANKKFKKALRIAKMFRWLPFIKVIFVCNDLAYSNAPEESDIDLAIITSRKRIWLTRFFTVSLLKVLGLRPTSSKTKDKICLTFFVSEDNLNLQDLMINHQDIHFIYWLAQFVPIYIKDDSIWQKFIQVNHWLKEYLPNWQPYQMTPQRQIKPLPKLTSFVLNLSGKLVTNLDEKFYKWLQLKIMPKRLKRMANQDTRVTINDQILKFHDKDNRREIQEKFNQIYESIKENN